MAQWPEPLGGARGSPPPWPQPPPPASKGTRGSQAWRPDLGQPLADAGGGGGGREAGGRGEVRGLRGAQRRGEGELAAIAGGGTRGAGLPLTINGQCCLSLKEHG